MSKYGNQIHYGDVICPYCKNEYQREAADYSEDRRIEKCDNCGKKFHTYDDFSVAHNTQPDCELNGDEHTVFVNYFCITCGKYKGDGK
jgi:transposase-like protein